MLNLLSYHALITCSSLQPECSGRRGLTVLAAQIPWSMSGIRKRLLENIRAPSSYKARRINSPTAHLPQRNQQQSRAPQHLSRQGGHLKTKNLGIADDLVLGLKDYVRSQAAPPKSGKGKVYASSVP